MSRHNIKGIKTGVRNPPVEFVAKGINMGLRMMSEEWRCDGKTAARWVSEQSPEWQAQRKANLAEKLRESGRKAQAIGVAAIKAKAAAKPIKVREKKPRGFKPPVGFFEFAVANTVADIRKEFGICKGTIYKALDAQPVEWRKQRRAATTAIRGATYAAKFAPRIAERAAAKAAAKAEIAAKRAAAKAEREAAKPAKAAPVAKKPRPGSWGTNKLAGVPSVGADLASLAMQHLRCCRYIPVCRGETVSQSLAGLYVVGSMKLPEAEMIDLARRKGWRPGAFLQVAA